MDDVSTPTRGKVESGRLGSLNTTRKISNLDIIDQLISQLN